MHDNVRLRAFASGGRQVTGVPALFTRHRGLARSIADGYFWAGAEKQDIRQEAEIGLWIACRNWDPGGDASFRTFAALVIRHRLNDLLRSALRQRQRPLNEALQGTVGDDGELLVELVPSELDTERVVVARDTLARMVAAVEGLSGLERQALALTLNGHPHAGGRDKQIDNAASRARAKLRKAAA